MAKTTDTISRMSPLTTPKGQMQDTIQRADSGQKGQPNTASPKPTGGKGDSSSLFPKPAAQTPTSHDKRIHHELMNKPHPTAHTRGGKGVGGKGC